jgi:hypothetical protein
MNVISQPIGTIAKLSTIAKIHNYKGFHERHHFIPMAMEVHGALGHDMDRFIKECVGLFSLIFSSFMLILFFNVL